jgi:hypothetical protein
MSTSFRPTKPIRCYDLFDGRLEKYGIWEDNASTETTDRRRCLSDGQYCIWVFSKGDGYVASLKRYGLNAVGKVLQVIGDAFQTDIISEQEAQDWGLDKIEEWKAWLAEVDEQWTEEEYNKIQKYLRGEPCDIRFGTNGEELGEIARKLIANDPKISLPEYRDKLVAQAYSIWTAPPYQEFPDEENEEEDEERIDLAMLSLQDETVREALRDRIDEGQRVIAQLLDNDGQ